MEGWRQLVRTDPLNFANKVLRLDTMWWGAEKIISSVFTHKRTAVQSGHSLSKDWSAGIIALQWLFTHYPSKVILTAPTGRQVQKITFGEMRMHFDRLLNNLPWPLSRDCLMANELRLDHDWFLIGFTTKEPADSAGGKFHGFKSPNLLVIVTEAQDVDDSIFDQIEFGLMTGSNCRMLEIANPMKTSGRFWEHCTQPKWDYNVIKLSCFDSPNVIENREVIPGLVMKEYVENVRRVWGESHPYWYARVLGEFPQSSSKALIPLDWILRAKGREIPDNDHLIAAGHDVAGDGTAETAICVLEGRKMKRLETFHKMSIAEQVGWAKGLIKEEKIQLYACDEGGLAGVASFLEEERMESLRVKFGEASETEEFDNLAAEMWWELRGAFERNEISILDDEILVGQLAAREFDFTSRGKRKITLEPKGEAAKRGHKFFDRADSLVLAWWARSTMQRMGLGPSKDFENEATKLEKNARRSRQQSMILESDEIRY